MREDNVFWFGRRPGGKGRNVGPAESEAFRVAITAACESEGLTVQRFIVAQGPYGTWLVETEDAGSKQRILWNGKDQQLILQTPLPTGGWEDPAAVAVASQDTDGFTDGIRKLLASRNRQA